MSRPRESVRARLERRTKTMPNGCIVFTGYVMKNGYAQIFDGTEKRLVHRVAHELYIGPIPAGYTVDHVRARGCMYRHCVNPDHLEAVTQRENTMRGDSVSAINAAKTSCLRGHDFTPENTRIVTRPDGSKCRACRPCDAVRAASYRDRRAA